MNIKKQMILISFLLGSYYIAAMEMDEKTWQLQDLPPEIRDIIQSYVLTGDTLEEAIQNFRRFGAAILKAPTRDLEGIIQLLSHRYNVRPLVVVTKFKGLLPEDRFKEIRKKAIEAFEKTIKPLLDQKGITVDELKNWYESNIGPVDDEPDIEKINDKIEEYLRSGDVELKGLASIFTYSNIDPNITIDDDLMGEAPVIVWAAFYGYEEVVRLLIEAGADFDSTDLIETAFIGNKDIVELLIKEAGVDINAKGNDGKSALDIAQERGHDEIVELLKQHGAK